MNQAVILSACRTPIGKFLGSLSSLSATRLGGEAIAAAVQRAGIDPATDPTTAPANNSATDPAAVDEAIMGNVLSAGLGQAPARQAALAAGLPHRVAALTVNKVCGSGLKAAMLGTQAIRLGDAEVVVAGGMESMSGAPHLLRGGRAGWKLGEQKLVDSMLHDGLVCAQGGCHMGAYADRLARSEAIGRAEQDRYAAESQRRAAAAIESGAFDDEIVPIPTGERGTVIRRDEGPRPDTTVHRLGQLKPAFEADGTITAGNASMLSDGAAALVMSSDHWASEHGFIPLARVVAYATAGTAPENLYLAPVQAVQNALQLAGLTPDGIDLYELNEAFAAQMIACTRRLELDPERVNVHGGAIALGHPIGASGARLLVTLIHAMQRRNIRWGLAALCLGGGNAVAMIVERDNPAG